MQKTTERQEEASEAVELKEAMEPAADMDAGSDSSTREEVKSEEEEHRFERDHVVKPVVVEPFEGGIYGSIYLSWRSTNIGSILGDAGARVGLEGERRVTRDSWIYARPEAGFDELDQLFSPGGGAGEGSQGDCVFASLYNVGIEIPVWDCGMYSSLSMNAGASST